MHIPHPIIQIKNIKEKYFFNVCRQFRLLGRQTLLDFALVFYTVMNNYIKHDCRNSEFFRIILNKWNLLTDNENLEQYGQIFLGKLHFKNNFAYRVDWSIRYCISDTQHPFVPTYWMDWSMRYTTSFHSNLLNGLIHEKYDILAFQLMYIQAAIGRYSLFGWDKFMLFQ